MRTFLAMLLLCACTSIRLQDEDTAWAGRPAVPRPPGNPSDKPADAAPDAMPTPIAPADAMPPAPKPDAAPMPVDAAPPTVDATKPPDAAQPSADAAKPDATEPVDATPEPTKDGSGTMSTRMSMPGECPIIAPMSCISGHCWSQLGGRYTIWTTVAKCQADGSCSPPLAYRQMDGLAMWEQECRIGACVLICE